MRAGIAAWIAVLVIPGERGGFGDAEVAEPGAWGSVSQAASFAEFDACAQVVCRRRRWSATTGSCGLEMKNRHAPRVV
jgi:hypothetical protein